MKYLCEILSLCLCLYSQFCRIELELSKHLNKVFLRFNLFYIAIFQKRLSLFTLDYLLNFLFTFRIITVKCIIFVSLVASPIFDYRNSKNLMGCFELFSSDIVSHLLFKINVCRISTSWFLIF